MVPLDLQRTIYVEAESSKIGRVAVPQPLVQRLRASSCIEVAASLPARLDFLLRDYANLGDNPDLLAQQLGVLKELHGKQVIARWQDWAQAGALPPLFAELVALHYDPLYARSQSTHLHQWAARHSLASDDLSEAGIDALAAQVLALG